MRTHGMCSVCGKARRAAAHILPAEFQAPAALYGDCTPAQAADWEWLDSKSYNSSVNGGSNVDMLDAYLICLYAAGGASSLG